MVRFRSLVVFLVWMVTALPSYGAETKLPDPLPVKILSFPIPPLLHNTADGDFSGTLGETVKALCEAQNLACSFSVLPLARAYLQLRNGSGDALITLNFGQFKKCCSTSAWASPWSAGFFSSSSSMIIPETPKDLLGTSIIAVNGMKSPYLFAPNLDEMVARKELSLFSARDISTAVSMFIGKRAPLLWGSDDFTWYFEKIDNNADYIFTPRVTAPVVIWVRKEKQEILRRLNQA